MFHTAEWSENRNSFLSLKTEPDSPFTDAIAAFRSASSQIIASTMHLVSSPSCAPSNQDIICFDRLFLSDLIPLHIKIQKNSNKWALKRMRRSVQIITQ